MNTTSNKKFNIVNTRKPVPSLGKVIASERARQKMSLDELAKSSGVSKGMLSQIEQEKTNPTVAVLYKIAAGLHVEPTRLLPSTSSTPRVWRVIRADDERYVFSNEDDCRIRTLSPLDLEKQVELYEITIGAKGKLSSEAHYQGTDEILTVVQGQLQISSGERVIEVKKGDSVHYAADIPHQIANLGSSKAQAILLVWYRS